MVEHFINSFQEYIKVISDINESESVQFFSDSADMRTVYRGQSDKSWKTIPSIFRSEHTIKKERIYLREFIRLFPEETNDISFFEILTKAQHYGLPTRLLDYTFNPLVALYFACNSNEEKDGVVIVRIMQSVWNYDAATVNVFMHAIFHYPNRIHENDIVNNIMYSMKRDRYIYDLPEEEAVSQIINTNYVNYIKPKLNSSRLRAQNGLFALYPLNYNEMEVNDATSGKVHYLFIKKECKSDMLKYLDYFDINEALLFPELDKGLITILKKVDMIDSR